MGDRANWGFIQEMGAPIINLYTHWHGSQRHALLANALDYAKPRWPDPSYSTRIVISQIVGDEWANETGWGLTVDELGDNGYSYLLVMWDTKKVVEVPIDWNHTGKSGMQAVWGMAPTAKVTSFDDFIQQYATQRTSV